MVTKRKSAKGRKKQDKKGKGRGGKREKKPKYIASYAYKYGARRPVEAEDIVNDQLFESHLYRNKTVEYERQRREEVTAQLLKLPGAGKLLKIERSIARHDKLIRKLRARKKLFHMHQRSKRARWPKIEAIIKQRVADRAVLYKDRKTERNKLFKSAQWKAGEAARKAAYDAKQRQLYKNCPVTTSGTKGRVKRDARKLKKGPPPRFKRWDGQNSLSLQIPGGVTLEQAFSGEHKHLRIILVEGGIWESGTAKARGKPPVDLSRVKYSENMRLDKDGYAMRKVGNAWVYMRVGSLDKEGKPKPGAHEPLWTKFPINYHRPLPTNTIIKEVYLQRKKIGTSERWFFHCILDEDTRERKVDPTLATSGYVAIDVGWRLVTRGGKGCGFNSKEHSALVHGSNCPQKALRVAYWLGSDGRSGEVLLSERMMCAYYKVHDNQSIRDNKFNAIRSDLHEWIKEQENVPQWLAESTHNMYLWHNPVRLVRVVFEWRENRFDGDEQMFKQLEDWRATDKHLLNYECHLRDQVLNQRKDIYRKFVAEMRRYYATVILEDINMTKLAARKKPEEAHLQKESARRNRSFAAISHLRGYFEEKMAVIKVNPAGTSATCSACGAPAFAGSADIEHECSNCGRIWDRDHNAAVNILNSGMPKQLAASA